MQNLQNLRFSGRLWCASALITLALFGCGTAREAIKQRYFKAGERHMAAGKYREASVAFRKAIQRDPSFGDAHYQLALAELQPGGNIQRAVSALQRASALLPEREEVQVKFADLLFAVHLGSGGTNKEDAAVMEHWISRILSKNPDSFDGLRLKAQLALLEKRDAEALELFRSADKVKPMQPAVVLGLVQSLARTGQPKEAEALALSFLEKEPANPDTYEVLYRQYVSSGRLADAESLLKKKAAAFPSEPGPILQLAGHYHRSQQPGQMSATLDSLLSDPTRFPQGRLLAGDFLRSIGQWDGAFEHYGACSKEQSAQALECSKRVAAIHLLRGERDEALKIYETVTKSEPKDQVSRTARAALLLDKDVEGAIGEFQAMVRDMPNNPFLRYNLGAAYLAKRDVRAARSSFQEALRLRRDYLEPRLALTRLNIEAGEFRGAVETVDAVLQNSPRHSEARLLKCVALTGLGDYRAARAGLSQLLKDIPDNREARLQMAYIDLLEKKFDAAAATLRGLRASGNDARVVRGLVELEFAQGAPERAWQVASEEHKKLPEDSAIRLLAAETAFRAGKYPPAIEHYTALVSANPRWELLLLRLGEAYRLNNDIPNAIASFSKARELAPSNLEAVLRLAFTLDNEGKTKEAMVLYREAMSIDPKHPDVLNNLAYAIAETGGSLDEALDLAQRALKIFPQDKNISDTIGWIYLQKGMLDSALQVFEKLVREEPTNPIYRYHLAVTLAKKGDKARAKRESEEALAGNPPPLIHQKIRDLIRQIG